MLKPESMFTPENILDNLPPETQSLTEDIILESQGYRIFKVRKEIYGICSECQSFFLRVPFSVSGSDGRSICQKCLEKNNKLLFDKYIEVVFSIDNTMFEVGNFLNKRRHSIMVGFLKNSEPLAQVNQFKEPLNLMIAKHGCKLFYWATWLGDTPIFKLDDEKNTDANLRAQVTKDFFDMKALLTTGLEYLLIVEMMGEHKVDDMLLEYAQTMKLPLPVEEPKFDQEILDYNAKTENPYRRCIGYCAIIPSPDGRNGVVTAEDGAIVCGTVENLKKMAFRFAAKRPEQYNVCYAYLDEMFMNIDRGISFALDESAFKIFTAHAGISNILACFI